MATKKNNKNKKIVMPKVDFIVDLTYAETAADVYSAFAYAKADKYFTRDEFNALVEDIVDKYGITFNVCSGECPFCKPAKKPNIFKRIWNWITGK